MKKIKGLISKKGKQTSERVKETFFLTRFLRSIGRIVDWIFKYNVTLIIVAILSSSLLYIYVVGMPDQLELTNLDTKTIENVEINVINEDNAKVISVYDDQGMRVDEDEIIADVIVKGPRNEVLKLINDRDLNFFIDTSSIKDGEIKEMQVMLDQKPPSVTISTSPSFFKVEANKKVTSNDFVLQAEAVNKTQMAKGLTIESLTLITNETLISGSTKEVNSVVSVKALVDVGKIQTKGVVELGEDKIIYKAYNNLGEVLDVDIAVKHKGATVVVTDYSREVPVKYNFVGETPEGKSIGSVSASVTEVRIYGDKSNIDIIEEVVVDVNLSDFSGDNVTVNIPNPDGVISMSEKTSSVSINFEDTESIKLTNIPVSSVGLGDDLIVQSTEDGALVVDVTVEGALIVINSFTEDDIILEVDLTDLPVGKHVVPIVIKNPDSRTEYTFSKEFVELEITSE